MQQKIFLIIIGMAVVTYIPRMLPLVVLSKVDIPPLITRWLKYVPVAVLSALLFPSILMSNEKIAIGFENKAMLAAIPCILIAYKTKNLFLTVSVGIGVMFLIRFFKLF